MEELFRTGTHLVFPADIVAASFLRIYPQLRARTFHVHPQGLSDLPPYFATIAHAPKPAAMWPAKDVVVLGAGTITPRKGVEFFLAAASAIGRRTTHVNFRFLWIGSCFDLDRGYYDLLMEQVRRSDLTDMVEFAGEVEDLAPFLRSEFDVFSSIATRSDAECLPGCRVAWIAGDLLRPSKRFCRPFKAEG